MSKSKKNAIITMMKVDYAKGSVRVNIANAIRPEKKMKIGIEVMLSKKEQSHWSTFASSSIRHLSPKEDSSYMRVYLASSVSFCF